MGIHKIAVSAIALGGLIATSIPAAAASPNGTWLRSKTGGHIKVFNCGGGIGMKVIKSNVAAKRGKQIMCGAKKSGSNKWKGNILNLDDGKTYTGIVTLTSANSLTLEGCVLGGLICKSDAWKRIK